MTALECLSLTPPSRSRGLRRLLSIAPSTCAMSVMQNDLEYKRAMTKRVLWKLDIHVLPPLALVRLRPPWIRVFHADLVLVQISCGWQTLLTGRTSVTQGEFSVHSMGSLVKRTSRIAGLERDTHLHGTQFNTALAGMSSSAGGTLPVLTYCAILVFYVSYVRERSTFKFDFLTNLV